MRREIYIPQAMQRHTGCAWVTLTQAADKIAEPECEPSSTSGDIERPELRSQSED